jgi:allantoin racemase
MELLVVNSNTSVAATKRIDAAAQAAARAGTTVTCIAALAGPQGIDGTLDLSIAGLETVRAIARNRTSYDAFIIACGNDPGLAGARQVTSRPVIGIAEAGILCSWPLGLRFSIPVLSRSKVALMEDLVRGYGLERRLASVVPIDATTGELIAASPDAVLEALLGAGRVARDRDYAEALVLTGSIMSGHEAELSGELQIPVISGLAAAVKMAESLVDLGLSTSQYFSFATPTKVDELNGYADLHDVYQSRAST